MTRGNSAAKGFTLIEVLIAAAILGIAFVAVTGVMSQSLRNIDRMGPQEQVLLHAREAMTELLLQEQLAPGRQSGQWDDGYRWQADIAPYPGVKPDQFGAYGLFEVRLQIAWGDREHPKTYVVETTQWARRPNPSSQP
ncbi:MAG TPA: prepilin-type N-terminal cleavage/methylation domain-containing protein [Candidatus Acidoferrales bacterium]|nr:prepilin-type N-terminal cleavage/methylation domain-containing protein [Candidatus Acidoferrales bacterium]